MLNSFIESWQRYLRNSCNLSENTVVSYASDLKQLMLFLEKYNNMQCRIDDFKNLNKVDMRAWFLSRKNAGESSKTISRGLSAVKSFLKFLIKEGQIESSVILSIKSPKIEKTLPRPLNITQINDIMGSIVDIKQTSWLVKRDKALLALIYSAGLRVSEALNLNKETFLSSSEFISVLGKGGKIRMVPIVALVKKLILDYLNACKFNDFEPLFINNRGERLTASAVQKLIKKSRRLLGLSDNVTPHAFRHSCATHLMENTGDLRGIQELLGHSSISSTQIYADVAKKYISEVYDKCHPLSNQNNINMGKYNA
ncbi:MAG: tyrosine recombinase XerC [Alphaproteobacteria bacterium]|nr:tyrosine recombinase XerC [Alphaproteobacteria bacterium]